MRISEIAVILLALFTVTGCGTKKAATPTAYSALPGLTAGTPDTTISRQPLAITPEKGLNGKVVSVDASARFVVVGFAAGRLPAQEQRFNIYRQGLKVGQI